MSLTFQVRTFVLNTVSSLVAEGNIPPYIWASSQQMTSYTRHILQCIHLQVPLLSCSVFRHLTWHSYQLFFFFFFPCLGTFYSLKSEFPAEELEKIAFAEDAVIVLLWARYRC